MPNPQKPLDITGDAKLSVPTFACIVYICKNEDGTVSGRVANLTGGDTGEITASGNAERDVLGKLTREFKSTVSVLLEEGREIPWIDPVPPPLENELIRSIPMHL